jgi:hypothetical protein
MKRQHAATMQHRLYLTKSIQSNYGYERKNNKDCEEVSITSLPPPPRTKRLRNLPDRSLASNKLGNFLAVKTVRENTDGQQEFDLAEYSEMVSILPATERFKWLQDVIDEMSSSI